MSYRVREFGMIKLLSSEDPVSGSQLDWEIKQAAKSRDSSDRS